MFNTQQEFERKRREYYNWKDRLMRAAQEQLARKKEQHRPMVEVVGHALVVDKATNRKIIGQIERDL